MSDVATVTLSMSELHSLLAQGHPAAALPYGQSDHDDMEDPSDEWIDHAQCTLQDLYATPAQQRIIRRWATYARGRLSYISEYLERLNSDPTNTIPPFELPPIPCKLQEQMRHLAEILNVDVTEATVPADHPLTQEILQLRRSNTTNKP